jgi:hypothetical protein
MNEVMEWVLAVLVIGLIIGFFLLTGTLFLVGTVLVMLAFAGAVFIDVLLMPFAWISSLFSSTKEKRTREEDG